VIHALSIEHFLATLYADGPAGSFVEVRYRRGQGMRQAFFGVEALGDVASMIRQRSAYTDVYMGIIPRRRRGGGRDDLVHGASVVWVDCDTEESVSALRCFSPPPSIIVETGTDQHLHGYWVLTQPADLDAVEHANRRLAHAIGADIACTDAARISRPPSSLNWKHRPPGTVRVARCSARRRHAITDVAGDLIDPPGVAARSPAVPRDQVGGISDPLLAIDPATYIELLTGARVPRSGKIACLFHDDGTPSLHVYREPERGWYCYGCGRGGSVYDFGAYFFHLTARGRDFWELRERLADVLLPLTLVSKMRRN
jgi:hypothetical protein